MPDQDNLMNNTKRFFSITLIPLMLFMTFSSVLSLYLERQITQTTEGEFVYYFPIIQNNKNIPASTSYYLPTTEVTFLFNLGCAQGLHDLSNPGVQDSVAVLDFSYPVYSPELGFGAALFEDAYSYTEPASIAAIEAAVKGFAQGYYECSGADTRSNLVIGVGTNNKGTSIKTNDMAAAHGAAWSTMVSNINQWALNEGIFHQVQTYGASNIEVGWNSPEWTRAWISGFEQNGENFMLHFGDASGCPYEDYPNWACNNNWELEDLWYVSWGAPSALPLPLIYLNNGVHAKQWAFVSQYSIAQHGGRMDFTGVFTQFQYCEQWRDAPWSTCDRTDNTPEEAYFQLINELNKYPSTAQELRWKTDIRWVFEDEVLQSGLPVDQIGDVTHPIYHEIEQIEGMIDSPDLSKDLQTSLQLKLNIAESIASMVEKSRQNPAPKK
jgi:hypothetical protein